MLDRDHALTEKGVQQAEELNARWREYETQMEGEFKQFAQPSNITPPPMVPSQSHTNVTTTGMILICLLSISI